MAATSQNEPSGSKDKKNAPASSASPREPQSFMRSTMPYLAGAAFAAAVMAWYFFMFVPEKLEYFVGLRFRTLAVASGQIGSKADGLMKSLNNAVRAAGQAREVEARSLFLHLDALVPDYLEELVPEMHVRSDQRPIPGLMFSSDATRLVPSVDAAVGWDDVVRPAVAVSTRDFDDLILADSDGEVVWQREKSSPRIGNLNELLGQKDDDSRWSWSWEVQATTPKAHADHTVAETATLKPVKLGGTSILVLVQAVNGLPSGIASVKSNCATSAKPDCSDDTKKAAAKRAPLYVAGVVSRRTLQAQAMRIPIVWIVVIALPIALLFLALPFVKLATLTQTERYSFSDLVFLAGATICAAGIGGVLPFVPRLTGTAGDQTLATLASEIGNSVGAETARILRLADAIETHRWEIETGLTLCKGYAPPRIPAVRLSTNRCGLWSAVESMALSRADVAPGALELDIVAWLDQDGNQVRKWTTKATITASTPHSGFAHFRDVQAGRTWTLAPAWATDAATRRPFTAEPLLAPTTSELGVLFALPSHADEPFLVLNVLTASLVDTIVPPGYGFAVIAEDGKVLFHSQPALSLQEHFLDEVGDPDAVGRVVHSTHSVTWSGDYHGRPHRLHVQRLDAFVDSPWRIVTFQEMDPLLETAALQQSGVLKLGALNLLMLGALAFGYMLYAHFKNRTVRDLLLWRPTIDTMGVVALASLAAFTAGVLSMTYVPGAERWADRLYFFFLGLPLLALGVFAGFSRRARSRQQVTDGLAPATALALLVVLVAAAPVAGFARILERIQAVQYAERALEAAQHDWDARLATVHDRVARASYDEDTRRLLTRGFAGDRLGDLVESNGTKPRYSYLGVTGQPLTQGSDAAPARALPDAGQEWVRKLLVWSPLPTRDAGGATRVVQAANHLQLSLQTSQRSGLIEVSTTGDDYHNFSGLNVLIGLVILLQTIGGANWARKRLMIPASVPAPKLATVMAAISQNDEAILMVGPPRTGKDRVVEDAVREITKGKLPHRIYLLEAEISEQYVEDRLKEIGDSIATSGTKVLDAQNRFWIHISNLETQLVDAESRKRVLRLFECLLKPQGRNNGRGLVVTTTIDPIANFEELFQEERKDIYSDAIPEVQLARSSLLLSRFRRCFLPIAPLRGGSDGKTIWDRWLDYKPAEWSKTLKSEVDGYEALAPIAAELHQVWSVNHPVAFDELSRAIMVKAAAYYELLWASCTRSEKLVLIQLAQEGLINPGCWDVATRLMAKGLIVDGPVPTIFNYTFRAFLQGIERRHVVHEWERMDGVGVWVVAGRLIGSSLAAGGIFFLLTQNFPVQSVLPIVSGTGLFGVPIIRDLLARFSGKPGSGSPAATA